VKRRRVLLLLLLACAGLASAPQRPPGLADVRKIRHWSYPNYTRVVVELTRVVQPSVHRLAADTRAARPERLYLDLGGVWVGRRYTEPIHVGDGLLHGVRVGQNTLRTTRVVIDLKRYSRHRLLVLQAPDRVVIDIYGQGRGEARSAPTQDSLLSGRSAHRVVLDPGHGGADPGARGIGGLLEKQLTLRLGLALRQRLVQRGFEVIMTRASDRTLSLEERTVVAEAAGGDLFVSLHANAAPRRTARGIETYYLNASDQRHNLTVAARENNISRGEVNDLQRTLATFRVSEVSPYSRELAQQLQRSLISRVRGAYGDVRDLGAKRGPFYVLFLSSMPSVLVEMGFLTNQAEAARLRDPAYMNLIAEAIADGITRYHDSLQTIAAVELP